MEQEIVDIFTEHGHMWMIDGELRIPSLEDVEQVLDRAIARLYDEDVNTRLEIGGLIADKAPTGGHDVYVYLGTIY